MVNSEEWMYVNSKEWRYVLLKPDMTHEGGIYIVDVEDKSWLLV